jgi:integrase
LIRVRNVSETKLLSTVTSSDALVHGFRHHYGLQLALRGLPPATLQQLMGHSDPRTTALYTRHASFDLINALDDAGWLQKELRSTGRDAGSAS